MASARVSQPRRAMSADGGGHSLPGYADARVSPWNGPKEGGLPTAIIRESISVQKQRLHEMSVAQGLPWLLSMLNLLGTTESPKGSNRGPAPDLAWRTVGRPGFAAPWCAATVSAHCIIARLHGWSVAAPGHGSMGSVQGLYKFASDAGALDPVPNVGDVFFQIRGIRDLDGVDLGHNHTGFVVGVELSTERIVTLEGNASDSFKLGVRKANTVAGYASPIQFHP